MSGFILGRSKESGELLRYDGDAPIITIAPTGTGKTAGPVICNALTHKGPMICLDVKGKVYEATADRRRAMGQEVYKIDFRDTFDSDAINPVELVRHMGSDYAILARGMAAEMIERTGDERDLYWINSAETMLTGGLSYILNHLPTSEHTLERLFDLYSKDDVVHKLAMAMDSTPAMNKSTHAAWAAFLSLTEVTRSCVHSCTIEHIRLFDSEAVNRCTRKTSFDPAAIVDGEPISIYIIVPPYRMRALKPVLRLILSSLLNLIFMRGKAPAERTLMLIDEAYQLGRLDSLLVASTLGREYGVTLHTIWQNMAQLDIYGGQARTIIDNGGAFRSFGMRNMRMADEVAAMLGGVTGKQLMTMGRDEMLVSLDGERPKIAKQVRYYQDGMFKGMYPAELAR